MKPQLITILFLTLFFSANAFAQQTNQWRGLVLDQATPEQALETLGKPKVDKPAAKFRPMKYDEWFDYKKTSFRMLEFDKIEGFSKVKLFFLEGTLRAIRTLAEETRGCPRFEELWCRLRADTPRRALKCPQWKVGH